MAGLIHVTDTLYGTTFMGGVYGLGTIFSVTLKGVETRLHSFSGSDGMNPTSLTKVGSKFFGTTQGGPRGFGAGVVFSSSHHGIVKVVHSFDAGVAGGLINVGGTLYGSLAGYFDSEFRCGNVFAMTPGGVETVLHEFTGKPDACWSSEFSSLTNVNGTLYGTTIGGGTIGRGYYPGLPGWGAVFRVIP